LGAALLLFLFTTLKEYLPVFLQDYEEIIHSGLIVCTHCLLVISAAIHGYLEKMIFNEQAKTYQHMFQIFRIAREKLCKKLAEGNLEEASEIILELGTEALMENADWLLLHRSRPMEIPKG
jgi:soluble cytochrome b562